MATLKKLLVEDMKEAMKEKEKMKVSVIRMLRASIKNTEINKRKELTDEEVIDVLVKEIKQYQESKSKYKELGKKEAVQSIEKEIEILSGYLPDDYQEDIF